MKTPRFDEVESWLKEIAPAPLSEEYLDHLGELMADDVEGELNRNLVRGLNPDLSSLERTLSSIMPRGMSSEMIERLDSAMSRWHEGVPVEEKVVPMSASSQGSRGSWIGLRSVASVACLGALVALFGEKIWESPATVGQRIPVSVEKQIQPVSFRPGVVDTSIVKTQDRGLIWTKAGEPVRCQEVVLRDRLHFVNERGEKLIIEKPKREVHFSKVEFD